MRDYNRELTESELTEIARLRRKNYSYREISQLMNISLYRATIFAKKWENSQKEELEALRKENASLKKQLERIPKLQNEIEYLNKDIDFIKKIQSEAIETVCSITSHLEDYPPEVSELVKFYLRSRTGNFF